MHPQFSKWLSDVPENINQAYCRFWHKIIEFSNMGIGALNSHYLKSATQIKGARQNLNRNQLQCFLQKMWSHAIKLLLFLPSQTEKRFEPPFFSSRALLCETVKLHNSDLNSYLLKDDILKAKCLWAMHVITKKMFYNSCKNIN